MAYSAEESSPVAYVSDPCCICDEEFSSDVALANHLIDHTNEEEFKALLAEKDKSRHVPPPPLNTTPTRPIAVVGGRQVIPEFTKTSFVREPPVRKKPVVPVVNNTTPSVPEVWEIVSDSDDEEPNSKKAKLNNSFRLVTPGGSQTNSTGKETGPPFHCHSCSSVFNDAVLFREHLLTHDKPRPYICHICKKSFAYKGTLRQHLHLHISEKSHECKVCHKKFTIKSLLRKHEETHEMPQLQEQKNS